MALLSSGLLCFAWKTSPRAELWEQIVAEVVVGSGMYMVWVTATVYLQDLYTGHANSALAACAFVRYAVGAGFPMLAKPLYNKFGIRWVCSRRALSLESADRRCTVDSLVRYAGRSAHTFAHPVLLLREEGPWLE